MLILALKLATRCNLGPNLCSVLLLQFGTMFPARGTRPKSAMPVRPSWLADTPAGSGAVSLPPNNPPVHNVASSFEENSSHREAQVSSQGPVSINFAMGPMTTSIQFASEEQFNRHGYNVLCQAHAASVQLALMSTQLAANPNSAVPVIHPVFGAQNSNIPAIAAGSSPRVLNVPAITAGSPRGAHQTRPGVTAPATVQPGALCVRSSTTLSAFGAGLLPGNPDIQRPFVRDPTLPRRGWRHSGGLYWHLPSLVADEVEDANIANESLMRGTVEVCWLQKPTFGVWKPLSTSGV